VSAHYRSLGARFAWAALAVAAAAGFSTLGAWQWSRAQFKERLLAQQGEILAARVAQPLSAAGDANRAGELDWTAGRGRFDERVLYLDNQQRGGRAGLRVYGVLQAPDAPAPLLVDLGWLPWGAQRELPAVELPMTEVEVRGVLAPPPSTGLRMGPGAESLGEARWLLTRIEPASLAPRIGLSVPLAPRVLKLDPQLAFGYERDFDLLPNTLPPERHRGYAVQWFALAATVVIVYLILSLRHRRRNSNRKPR
jgi:surfeit locus 1 family protein